MTPISDKPIIDKKFFTIRNCFSIVFVAIASTSAWGVMSSKVDTNKADIELQATNDKSHILNFIKLNEKIDKNHVAHDTDIEDLEADFEREIYNGKQLTYRITSAQQKQIDLLILGDQEHRIRYKYIEDLLKRIEAKK